MKYKSLIAAVLAVGATLSQTHAVDITVAGDPIGGGQLVGTTFTIGKVGIGAGVNQWPAAENPPNAIDNNNTTKYLNFGKENTGYIVTPVFGSSVVTGARFATANDSPERDPLSFSLYGSNTQVASSNPGDTFSLANFTLITTQGIAGFAADPGRNVTVAPETFANATAYTDYLLVFPTLRNSASANSMQIGDAILTGSAVPEPATLGLLGLSTVGLMAFRRRR